MSFLKDRINETDPNDLDKNNQLKLRISDLKAERRTLELFIQEHDGKYVEMEIDCTIAMSMKKIEKT
jgi:phosphatidate phosphatase PAH1